MTETNPNKLPLVSICCITYNHAPFIRQSLEGMLMQQGVDYEILIHDDCSTDGTTEIVKEYAAKYPDVIFPIYETENLYKKVGLAGIDQPNYTRARGIYIAYCEGDDVWTDPLKLQRQVLFMEEHKDCTVCFTDYINYDYIDKQALHHSTNEYLKKHCANGETFIEVGLKDFFSSWITMPLTMMFRLDKYDFNWCKQYRTYRDQFEIYLLIKQGKCHILNFISAQRNVHIGGVSSMASEAKIISDSLAIAEEMYGVDRDKEVKDYYLSIIDWAMTKCRAWSLDRCKLALRAFKISPDVNKFIRDLKRSEK